MRNRTIAFIILLVNNSIDIHCQQPIPKVTQGKIERIENFKSNYVQPRNIDIWIPNDYSSKSKYAVLYMHDGQMLFDPEITWNKQSWNADETAQSLISEKTVGNFIIVGIWNIDSTRHHDYFPQKPFELMSKNQRDSVSAQLKKVGRIKTDFHPNSDNYLKFITRELKPYIDKNYSVYTNPSNTFIAGSSMGGLITIYAICEYPKIFGGAACISTHWPGTFSLVNNLFPQEMSNYLRKKLPNRKNHKVYFDCGDQTLDALYPNIQKTIDKIMREKGFNSNNWTTKFFPGENHSEQAWQKRLHVSLQFLFK
jgi:predicted alpha/beta superfamily hydrolase